MRTLGGISLVSAATTLFILAAFPSFAAPLSSSKDGYTASGSAKLKAGKVVLGSNFKFSGGPDVYVAVKSGGELVVIEKLRENSGGQTYALPASFDGDVDEIILWCKKFNVELGKATMN